MPRQRKKPIKKQEPEKISKKMAGVRPARDQAGRKRYDHGYKPAPEKDPWQDEGYPES